MMRRQLLHALQRDDHAELFIARYAFVWRRARNLAGDAAAADDLTQEAYLRFTLARPDLSRVENLDAYLHTIVRNVHLARVRRASHRFERRLEVLDYDSAEFAANQIDPRSWLLARHHLRDACAYGCQRRLTSKTGSAFLLRFFHALAPSEIASLARISGRTVEDWVRLGRHEVRQYLADPSRLGFISGAPAAPPRLFPVESPSAEENDPNSLIAELRGFIFSHRHGQCFDENRWGEIYAQAEQPVAVEHLAEIVACPLCLDRALELGGLPPLSTRSPFDDKRGGSGGATPAASPGQSRRSRQRIEHRPSELLLAVNGFIVGREHVSGERSEMSVSVTFSEPVGFIELLSEQDVCLLHLVVEPPPTGDVVQTASALLSDGRSVAIEVAFDHPWPRVRVSYLNPATTDVTPTTAVMPSILPAGRAPAQPSWRQRLDSWWEWIRGSLQLERRVGVWLVPARLAVALLLCILFGYAAVELTTPTVTAEGLLRETAQSEHLWQATPGQVAHRVVRLQERVAGSNTVRSSRRIETWQDQRRLKVMRVYDADGRLLAGEWQHEDGSRTLYRVGMAARSELPTATPTLTPDEMWRRDVTAADFGGLVPGDAALTLETRATEVDLHASGLSDALVSATLTVSSRAHRAVGQVLVVRVGAELLEYRFEEAFAVHAPEATLPPGAFDPEPSLVASPVAPPEVESVAPPARFPAAQLDSLEMRATSALYRLGACLVTPGRITRDPQFGLRLEALTAGESCRGEANAALADLAAVGGVAVDVRVAPARATPESALSRTTVADEELARLPVYRSLAEYYANAPVQGGGLVDDAARINQMVSRQVLWSRAQAADLARRAKALQHLNTRWPAAVLRRMDHAGLAAWQQLVRDHTSALAANARLLRLQLTPALQTGPPTAETAYNDPPRSVAAATTEIAQLCALVEAAHQDVAAWLGPDVRPGSRFTPIDDGRLRSIERRASAFGTSWTLSERP